MRKKRQKTEISEEAIEKRAQAILDMDDEERSRWIERKLARRIAYHELLAEQSKRPAGGR